MRFLLLLLVTVVGVLLPAGGPAARAHQDARPIVVLVSFDGWRWDYLDRLGPPATGGLAARGIRSEGLVPVYPSLTFPNHYSIVTGLRPASHGIVSNTMSDPALPGRFRLSDPAVTGNPAWWSGEPIWNTATRQGLRSATMFWPGSDVRIGGHYPTYWRQFEDALPAARRTDQVLAWLALPPAERPHLVTLYYSDVDTAGHDFGPDAPELREAVRRVDHELGRLVAGVDRLGLQSLVHWILVSDHGMAPLDRERVIVLDDFLDPASVRIVEMGPRLTLDGGSLTAQAAYDALNGRHPRLRVFRTADLPGSFGLAGHPRVPELVAHADEGWTVTTRERLARRAPDRPWGGDHGFDPASPTMRGLLVAAGPKLRAGVRLPPVENIQVYGLMCALLGIDPAPHEGDRAVYGAWLR